jgi:CrcB protein
MNALSLAYVAVGGAMGSMCRFMFYSLIPRGGFPLATFSVNILGAFMLGAWLAVIVYLLPEKNRDLHYLIAYGALGGFTTFSAFTLDTYLLLERGQMLQTMAYVVGSVLISLLTFFLGMWLVKTLAI